MAEASNTPVIFSRDELRHIRQLMKTPRARVYCPRCGETLVMAGPIVGEGAERRCYELVCRPCHRSAVITEAPWTDLPSE